MYLTLANNLKQGYSTTTVQVDLQSTDKSDSTLVVPDKITPGSLGAAFGNKKANDVAEQTPMVKKAKIDLLDPIVATTSASKEKVN